MFPPRKPRIRTRFLDGAALLLVLFLAFVGSSPAADTDSGTDYEPEMHPYTGPTRSDIDATTLDGKVLCGYQGWFNTPCDGTTFGFTHWGQGLDRPGGGQFTVD